MKILLINTNRMKPAIAPIGLDYLADSLVAAGHEPYMLDLCFASDVTADIGRAVGDFAPDVVGITIRNTDDCYFSGGAFFLPEIREVVQQVKTISSAPVILGGVGFSVAPLAVMDYCGADYGIAGEGEVALVQFLDAWKRRSDIDKVPNLLWRNGSRIRQNPVRYIDLDKLPPRTRTFVDNPTYFHEGGQAGFETKRGCDMNCIYCADPVSKGRRVRLRSPQRVVDELKALLSQGIDYFHTCDCEFNIPDTHAREICRAIIDGGLGERIRWYAYCSVVPFDAEMANLFRKAGCVGINFGADSGSDYMLYRLGKSFRSEDLIRTAKLCRQHGITFMYDLLLGEESSISANDPQAQVARQYLTRVWQEVKAAHPYTGPTTPLHIKDFTVGKVSGDQAQQICQNIIRGQQAYGGGTYNFVGGLSKCMIDHGWVNGTFDPAP